MRRLDLNRKPHVGDRPHAIDPMVANNQMRCLLASGLPTYPQGNTYPGAELHLLASD